MKKLVKKVATSALAATLVLPAGFAGAAAKFPDVNPNTVTPDVQQAIEALADQGIIKGFPDGTFGPNKSITRAQFAKILAQIKGLEPNPAAAAQFTDVKDPEQQGWVGALVAAGLTTGTTPTTYSPNRPIQRDQAATFLVRALELEEVAKELNLTPTTTDGARINASHKANVGLLEKVGLIKGYPDGSFGPGDPFKRQQAANLLYKVQQEGDAYVNAAKALLNKVEVVYNDNGTLTIKGSIKDAVTVDVVVREADTATTQAPGDVLFEQKGVQAENGEFEVTTSFIGNKAVTVNVTAYDAEGNVISTLEQKAQPSQEGEVKGYTDAPDLIAVRADGKYVYFTFDEEIDDVEDEDAFFLVSFSGSIIEAKEADVEKDKKTVKAHFYTAGTVATATIAGVKSGAVSDEDGNDNVEASLPLNNVKIGGSTGGPDLKSVKIDSFRLKQGGQSEEIKVEYVFDEEVSKVVDSTYAYKFVLYLKDGTKLVASSIDSVRKDSVKVTFDATWANDGTITSGNGTTSKTIRTYNKEIDRDDVAVAAVLPGAVLDDESNPSSGAYGDKRANALTVVDARTKVATNYLRSASIDFKDGEITFTFNRDVEGVIDATYVMNEFSVVSISGASTKIGDLVAADDIDIDGKKVTVELDKNSTSHSSVLASVVGVSVNDILASDEENERIVAGYAAVERTFNAGETYGPVLKKISSRYDARDEILTVTFEFSVDVKETSNAEDLFKLYNADGEEISADVTIDKVKNNEVTVEFEIDEEDYSEVVVLAVEQGAVVADDDFKVGDENNDFLINPAAHFPVK